MLGLFRREMQERVVPYAAATGLIVMPGDQYMDGVEGEDAWGVRWTNLGPNPQYDGFTPTPGHRVLDDIRKWKDVVRFPDYSKMPLAQIFGYMESAIDRSRQLVSGILLCGTFERMHALMGMENALCAFYDEPESVKELMHAITDSRIEAIGLMIDIAKPDVIRINDDWGTNRSLFVSPEMWREFFVPIEKRIAGYIHGRGVLYEHHSCGYIEPIMDDIVALGIDALNPMNVCNDIEAIMRRHGSDILINGGLDGQLIDDAGTTEEGIRAEVRRAIDAYAHLGLYSPYYIATDPERERIATEEALSYDALN
jgi:uroporphyrinogen decarboxylase